MIFSKLQWIVYSDLFWIKVPNEDKHLILELLSNADNDYSKIGGEKKGGIIILNNKRYIVCQWRLLGAFYVGIISQSLFVLLAESRGYFDIHMYMSLSLEVFIWVQKRTISVLLKEKWLFIVQNTLHRTWDKRNSFFFLIWHHCTSPLDNSFLYSYEAKLDTHYERQTNSLR